MNEHIRTHFQYPVEAQEKGIQGKVYVQFIINKEGAVEGVRLRGPDKQLEDEVRRMVSLLPQMKPGKQQGRPVNVPFSIPVNFVLE
jgi:TonB family protein